MWPSSLVLLIFTSLWALLISHSIAQPLDSCTFATPCSHSKRHDYHRRALLGGSVLKDAQEVSATSEIGRLGRLGNSNPKTLSQSASARNTVLGESIRGNYRKVIDLESVDTLNPSILSDVPKITRSSTSARWTTLLRDTSQRTQDKIQNVFRKISPLPRRPSFSSSSRGFFGGSRKVKSQIYTIADYNDNFDWGREGIPA